MELHLLEPGSHGLNNVLLIFARYPRLGRVKTRLNPALSTAQSLALYTAFLLDTLERTAVLNVNRKLFLADCNMEEATGLLAQARIGPVQLRLQQGADLGERMWNAYRSVEGSRVVFIGADSPTLPLGYVRDAFQALRRKPVALGPVSDGGYYLLALSEPRRRLFEGIDWGTDAVLAQTLERLHENEYTLLPPWHDIDTPADLAVLGAELLQPIAGYPTRTQRALLKLDPRLTQPPSSRPDSLGS